MLFFLVVGAFCLIAPTWILCAIGLGDFEDEAGAQWTVRIFGLILLVVIGLQFFKH